MAPLPNHIAHKLAERKEDGSYRSLPHRGDGIDFYSNNYLGLTQPPANVWDGHDAFASGSRLLSGNSNCHMEVEAAAEALWGQPCLLYNSGYSANLGLLQAIPQKGDIILYDALVHASIRDGLRLSHAKCWSYPHQDLEMLADKLARARKEAKTVYVVTEGLFSMNGSVTEVGSILQLCSQFEAYLILDEAHSGGVFGVNGLGLSEKMAKHPYLLATTFPLGKAFATCGCLVRCSPMLKEYLINFSRAFIYTTALPPNVANLIKHRLTEVVAANAARQNILALIQCWKSKAKKAEFTHNFGPIQFMNVPRSEHPNIAHTLHENGFELLPVKHPTVPEDEEGFRVILHAHNTEAEVIALLNLLQ